MLFQVLGTTAAVGSRGAVPLGGPRHRVLLAALLISPGRVVPTERLIEALWDDAPPASAAEMLHVRISELRKLLRSEPDDDGDQIVTRRPGYLLDIAPEQVDAHRFEQLATEGKRLLDVGDTTVAATRLADALALWRGPALADLADRAFARPEITRLDNLRVQALEDRISADLAAGRHRDVVAELEGLVQSHPLHERYRFQLMLALYRDGRQSDALEVYQRTADLLRDELGIDPGTELQELQISILRQDSALIVPTVAAAQASSRIDLPVQLTSFVGRDHELTSAGDHLATARLVTLTGVGGVGKSRLAVEIALARQTAFPDGIWMVELAAVGDPALVAATVAAAVDAQERPQQSLRDAILDQLRSASALLVLDNCEHLIDEVADLTRHLLRYCPGLRILCTSRERLDLAGEVVFPVPGLSVPSPGDRVAELVGASAAVRLFVDRAGAAQPRFRLTDENAPAVAEIARRLDGLPLSIELAAARTGAFAAGQIAHGLQDQFRLLSRGSRDALPRHQTLRAVVDWSYGLLTEPEQRLFNQLAVFVGGFTYEAVAAVCGEEPADLLARLVDKSLVVADAVESPEYRYRVLETLRAYGLEQLDRESAAAQARDAHARYYRQLATAAAAGLRSVELAIWLDRLDVEHGNLRAAMEWSLSSGDDETAAGIAAALYAFWDLRGYYGEGRSWLRRVLAEERQLTPAMRAKALMGAATLAAIQGDIEEAAAAAQDAAELSRASGDDAGLSHALQYLGFVACLTGELDKARSLFHDAQRIGARSGARWEAAWSYVFLAMLALFEDRLADAAEHGNRAELVIGPDGDQELLAWACLIRGFAAWSDNRLRDAAQEISSGAARFQTLRGLWGISMALLGSGLTLAADGRDEAATRMFGAAEAVRTSAGIGMLPFLGAWQDAALARLRARLTPETFATEWATGQAYTVDEAVRAAQSELAACCASAGSY